MQQAEDMRICLVGASGRMGREIAAAAQDAPGCEISYGVVSRGSTYAGANLPGIARPLLSGAEGLGEIDVVLDFSSSAGTSVAVGIAEERKCPLLVGTTALPPHLREKIEVAGRRVPVLVTSNTSIGMNLLQWLTRESARRLGAAFDIEIMELHHRAKKDAPSGSALSLARLAAEGARQEPQFVEGRAGLSPGRSEREIGIQALRGGDVPGEHTAMFLGQGERVELTHRVGNRRVFATGALLAARWLSTQQPGSYTMWDALGLA